MPNIMKVFLLLAVVVCFSEAQFDRLGNQCLCQRVKDLSGLKSGIKDLQIYPATVFCDRVEIVVTIKTGQRFCINPNLKSVKQLLAKIMKVQKSPTVKPIVFTSSPARNNQTRA